MLTAFQDRYNAFMNERGHALERGQSKQVTEKEHEDMDKFKQSTRFHEQKLEKVQEKLSSERSELEKVADLLQEEPAFAFDRKEKVTEVNDRIFGKAEILEKETENVVLNPDEVQAINEQLRSAVVVKKDYERLRNTEPMQEIERVKGIAKKGLELAKQHEEENKALKKENKKLSDQVSLLNEKVNDLKREMRFVYISTREFLKEHTEGVRAFRSAVRDFVWKVKGKMSESDKKLEKEPKIREFEMNHKKQLNKERAQGMQF